MTVWERITYWSMTSQRSSFKTEDQTSTAQASSPGSPKSVVADVAIYGHDFTVRAGSMDATNGSKLAQLFERASSESVIGFNDSAGAYVPAGVGGLDGYAEAFRAAGDFRARTVDYVYVRVQRRRWFLSATPGVLFLSSSPMRHFLASQAHRSSKVCARRNVA